MSWSLARRLVDRLGVTDMVRQSVYRVFGHDAARFETRSRAIAFFRSFVSSGDLVFDVGANVGDRTEQFLALGASVVAYEPQRECLKRLRRRFAWSRRVHIAPVGLSDSPGVADLATSEKSNVLSTLSSRVQLEGRFADHAHWNNFERIHLSTLDLEIAARGAPRFCKIDVEGHELFVLRGLSVPVAALSFEFMREHLDLTAGCIEHLTSLADYEFNFAEAESFKLTFDSWLSGARLLLHLETTDNPLLWGDVYARLRGALT